MVFRSCSRNLIRIDRIPVIIRMTDDRHIQVLGSAHERRRILHDPKICDTRRMKTCNDVIHL